jgi:hypothetical protein
MSGHTPLTDDEKGKIVTLARDGMGPTAIGRIINRDTTTVSRHLKAAGVSIRPDSKWSVYDDGDLENLLAMDFTAPAIRKIMQRSKRAIEHRRVYLGLTGREKKWTQQFKFMARPSTYRAAQKIGTEYNMSASEVCRAILRAVQRRELWRELLTPCHEILLVGDRK